MEEPNIESMPSTSKQQFDPAKQKTKKRKILNPKPPNQVESISNLVKDKKDAVKTQKKTKPRAPQKEEEIVDTLEIDKILSEEKLSKKQNLPKDIYQVAIDEISLEGLDGITIEALWTRISHSMQLSLPLLRSIELSVWKIICLNSELSIFRLPTPRPQLIVIDRFKHYQPEEEMQLYDNPYLDIYPFVPINDKANNIRGSCSTYYDRVDISKEAKLWTLKEAEKSGNSVVIVAGQELRNRALLTEHCSPVITLHDVQYNILERIGRSRNIGEVTCGDQSLNAICKDAKTLFYYRKYLIKNNLISKQPFYFRKANKLQAKGNLFHLQRFFIERKSRKQLVIEQIIKLLQTRQHQRMEYLELRKLIGVDNWEKLGVARIFKSPEFRQFVKTDVMLLYRDMYPEAVVDEWKRKAGDKEKTVRVLQLVNPNININSLWKDDDGRDSSSDDEPINEASYNMSLCKQSYDIIYDTGSRGVFMKELQSNLGVDFYLTRMIIKGLTKQNLIFCQMVDAGRQRYSKFVATCFDEKRETNCEETISTTTAVAKTPTDDETTDFIADILNIDSCHLKQETKVEVVETTDSLKSSELHGKYNTLRELRLKHIITDSIEKFSVKMSETPKNAKLRQLEDKKIVDEIHLNNHGYISNETTLDQKIISRPKFNVKIADNKAFKMIVGGIFANKTSSEKSLTLYSNKCNANESDIDIKLEKSLKTKYSKVIVTKKIRKFSVYLNKLYSKTPNMLSKAYKTYLLRKKIIIELLNTSIKDNRTVPTGILSSDEEGSDDNDSLNVHLDDEECTGKYQFDPDIKSELIDNFDKCDFSFIKSEDNAINIKVPNLTESTEIEPAIKKPKLEDEDTIKEDSDLPRMDIFMGPKPNCIYHRVDEDGVDIKLIVSTKPEDFTGIKTVAQTQRVIARCNMVKEIVKKHKMISDLSKIHQMITMTEKSQGYNVSVDRKSLFRIYAHLVSLNQIKIAKIVTKYEDIVRSKNMIVDTEVDIRTILQSTIDQFKMSFFIYAKRKVAAHAALIANATETKPAANEDNIVVEQKEEAVEKDVEKGNAKSKYKYSRTIGRIYGFYPKLAKMRVLHEFLYYLLYDYCGELVPTNKVPEVLSRYCDTVDDKLLNDCSPLYRKEISWKSFIPPLPVHKNWPNGWTLICDTLLRLPISIFVKIFNVAYIIPELTKIYLNHPIRKHLLIKNLPPDTRDAILNYRKYIFSIHEIFCYLCYLGVAQFGPQKYREKDQVFVYLNRNAVLYDTSSSEAGYHEVSTNIDYPKLHYKFDSIKDVERYWNNMNSISMKTKLGQRNSVLGKLISLENVHRKQQLISALKPQTPQSALEKDVGYLPGDKLGACCADSSIWLHVKRNWIWSSQKHANEIGDNARHSLTGIRKKLMDEVKPIKFSEYLKQKSKTKVKFNPQLSGNQNVRLLAKKRLAQMTANSTKAILRKVKPRKVIPKRIRVDQIDKGIIAKMGKSRATFCEEEDKLILICRAVIEYLCPSQRKRTVVHSTVRDFIHRILPYSRKTSSAYKRRSCQLKKSDNLHDKKQPLDFNLNADYFTQKHFKIMRDKLLDQNSSVGEIEISLAFLYLAYFTYKRYKATNRSIEVNEFKDFLLPNDLHRYKFNLLFDDDESVYPNPSSEDDIILDTIKGVIHSSLGFQNSTHEWPYQLLRIYQSFSETLLRNALSFLRDHQVISGKKATTKHSGGKEGSVLMSGFSYHLSFGYTFKQITKYPSYIFSEAHDLLMGIHTHLPSIKKNGKSIEKFEQGHGVGISELATQWNIHYNFDLPDDIITLDPSVEDHKDLITELALRYKTLLYKKNQDNENEETVPEDPEISKRLETVVENVIKSHFDKNDSTVDLDFGDIFNSEYERTVLPRPISSDETFGMNSDRRQKGYRISDLAFLLTKGLFPELDDDDRLEKLNKQFVVKYPTCKLTIDDELVSEFDIYKNCHLDVIARIDFCIEKVQRNCIIRNTMPSDEEIANALIEIGGDTDDQTRATEIINYIYSKNVFGATSEDLKEKFGEVIGVLSLENILEALITIGVILRAGITNFAFVHYNYRHNWTIYLDTTKHTTFETNTVGYRVKISPWVKIDSTVETSILYSWLNIVLSHCLSFPVLPFPSLCKRFCYVKPVDVYQLLEFLQELGCIKMMSYIHMDEIDLFSEISERKSGDAKLTDNFNDVFIDTDTLAMTKFGAFINRDKTVYTFPFDE